MGAKGALLDPDLVAGLSPLAFSVGELFLSSLTLVRDGVCVCGSGANDRSLDFLKHAAKTLKWQPSPPSSGHFPDTHSPAQVVCSSSEDLNSFCNTI